MAIRDLVLISFGEIVLALTFALGIGVGVSLMKRKDSHNDDRNEGTGGEAPQVSARYHRRNAHGE